jgi:hypothetical protein
VTETVVTPPAPTTPEGAQARLSELITANKEFGAKLLSGDSSARAEFNSLATTIAGGGTAPTAEELAARAERVNSDRFTQEFIRGVREQVDVRDAVLSQVIGGEKVTKAEFDAAKAWQARHLADNAWTKRLLDGDADAKRELFLCSVILSSGIKEAS